MIGVTSHPADAEIAEELFELFKTPWERAVPHKKYSVVLSTNGCIDGLDADLFLVYGSGETAVDGEAGRSPASTAATDVEWAGAAFPIYGRLGVFETSAAGATVISGGRAVDYRGMVGTRCVWRIGYDLFDEARHLLTSGQPVQHATIPTLEMHIALLRHLLLASGISFVEIPPRPEGHDFICCLTHDIDFYGIRRHKLDRTLAGFVARASVKTVTDLLTGRRVMAQAVRNWLALASLPFVFLRLAPDFWSPFDDYARVEAGSRSTFFVVPFKGQPGIAPDGTVNGTRAVSYEMRDIRDEMIETQARGSELAVHGLDAWRNADAGRAEKAQLTSITGQQAAGVRMHWLYQDANSPRELEAAGFDYDSTWGYNDGVGYRAGTSQVFRLADSTALMELPLSIMDSALFYPDRMNRSQAEAMTDCAPIVANAKRFGGTIVINWHDRSLVPERLWDAFYQELLAHIERGNSPWFTTAGSAVNWFRWRRSIRFSEDTAANAVTITTTPSAAPADMPGAVVHVHRPGDRAGAVEAHRFHGRAPVTVQL